MDKVYSVSQINYYIKDLFEQDRNLSAVRVQGETSNVKYHGSGHIYFTLKDAGGQLACVMFAGYRQAGLKFKLESGQNVIIAGTISVYERDGKYQLYARAIEMDGIGKLYEKYEFLKAELEGRGYFDPTIKKRIPAFPKRVGVVTASTGAALQDILNITKRRDPYVQIILCPARVQGEGAAATIVHAIKRLDAMGLDTIIVGRGGGSIEDLWAFNEESVATAIYEANTPIISAVGHETDFTIADFVADMRAPTPSAAAELAVPSIDDFLKKIEKYFDMLSGSMHKKLRLYENTLEGYRQSLQKCSPSRKTAEQREKLLHKKEKLGLIFSALLESEKRKNDDYIERLNREMEAKLALYRNRQSIYAARLDAASPLKKIASGYAYVAGENGENIRSIDEVQIGNKLTVTVTDGEIDTQVLEKRKNNA